ncbi:hypothetical protein HRbin41_01237 [bacterium HR41]|nr:hypothetical protein HRbin41_01237 [bacterium HR41]
MAQPLPHLGATDLGGGGILHQTVDRDSAATRQPGGDVAESDLERSHQPLPGALARCAVERQQVGGGDRNILAQAVTLVAALAEHAVELGPRRGHRVRVGHPGAVEAVVGLAALVGGHRRERSLTRSGVGARRNRSGHAADSLRAPPVAGAHEQLGVGAHEGNRHRHLAAVGQERPAVRAQALDRREDVVPPSGVQAERALAQLPEDLVHLERRRQRFDQHRDAHRAALEPELVLAQAQRLVPQPRLAMGFELRQIEVGAASQR